ncbi:hypothetical protein E3U43_001077 [Larimichthys crocea]|nr:hypothetical protein E3U43_001077 [Larimichthys crocea]
MANQIAPNHLHLYHTILPTMPQNYHRLPKLPLSPPLSPSHPDPVLLTSVTFTSSVSSHLYSPVCSSSSSFLRSLDSISPSIGLLPMMSSATPQLTTPPPTLGPSPARVNPAPCPAAGL